MMTVRSTIALYEPAGALPGGLSCQDYPYARWADNAFGNWGREHIAVAVPKDREKGMEYARRFVDAVQANGRLAQTVGRAGLRGVLEVRN
jgi:hypothetical protein